MTAPTKAQEPSADVLDLEAFVKTDIGRTMLGFARDMRAADAGDEQQRLTRAEEESAHRAIDTSLSAERNAFAAAGLATFTGADAEGYIPILYSQQPVILLNTRAHPAGLVSTALARAERAQAFARIFEQSSIVDGDAGAAAFTLTRMIEEVVEVLRVASGARWNHESAGIGDERRLKADSGQHPKP